MKRPRRPVKRKATKREPKTKKISITSVQAQIFDRPEPPSGVAYQWAPLEDIPEMQDAGWIAVPFERHRDFLPSRAEIKKGRLRGYISYLGQMLFQRDAGLVKMRHDWNVRAAKEQLENHPANRPRREGQPFHILSSDFVVSSDYGRVLPSEGTVNVDLTITFQVPNNWRDAAAALQLTAHEYARRRLLMDVDVIAKVGDGIFGPFEIEIKRKD